MADAVASRRGLRCHLFSSDGSDVVASRRGCVGSPLLIG